MWLLATMMLNFKSSSQGEKREKGFTFIEVILYVALISIFLTGAVYFAWDVIYGRVRSKTQQELAANIRLVAQRIQAEIRNADDLVSISVSVLELDSGVLGTTTIFLDQGIVKISQSGITSDLTNSDIEVTQLQFFDLGTEDAGSKNINFSIAARYKNPAQKKEWEKNYNLNTSV